MKNPDIKPRITKAAVIALVFCAIFAAWLLMRGPAEADKQIVMGPYIQDVTENEATIIWFTNFPAKPGTSLVKYSPVSGPDTRLSAEAAQAGPDETGMEGYHKHEARLKGLAKGQSYSYQVSSSDGWSSHASPEWTFHTQSGRFSKARFVFMADGHANKKPDVRRRTRAVLSSALKREPDFILYGGDLVEKGLQENWELFMRNVAGSGDGDEAGSGAEHILPIYMAVGNHEIISYNGYGNGNLDTSMRIFRAICANPDNGSVVADWKERYYAFSYGPCYIIVLDTNNTSDPKLDNNALIPAGGAPDWQPGSEQYKWMVERLKYAQENFPFTFVCFHQSPYSSGVHGDPNGLQSGYPLRALDPVLRQYGVDAVLTGHDHMAQRCLSGPEGFYKKYPQGMQDAQAWRDAENLNYIVDGNAGKSSRDAMRNFKKWMSINNDSAEPYYTVYFYGPGFEPDPWEGIDSYSSYTDISVFWDEAAKRWKATFAVVRVDVLDNESVHDVWWMERPDPLKEEAGER